METSSSNTVLLLLCASFPMFILRIWAYNWCSCGVFRSAMNQYDSLYYATSNPQARLPGPGDFASLGPPPVPGFSQAPAEYHQVLPNFSQPTYDQIYGRYPYYPPYNSTAATMGFYSTEVTPAAFQPAPTASKLTRGDAQQQQQQQQYVGASDTGNVETTPLLPKELLSNGSNERPVKQELESDHKNVVPVGLVSISKHKAKTVPLDELSRIDVTINYYLILWKGTKPNVY